MFGLFIVVNEISPVTHGEKYNKQKQGEKRGRGDDGEGKWGVLRLKELNSERKRCQEEYERSFEKDGRNIYLGD